jgi:3-hydroxybutyryl-CoA dehydratase
MSPAAEPSIGLKKDDRFRHQFTIDQRIYDGFISLFQDRNCLHVDGDYARQKGFSGAVMHGNILGGFLSYLVGECLPVQNVIIHSQTIKFRKPVYLNDTLELCATVQEVFESVSACELSFYFENQNHVKVAQGSLQIGLL